MTGHSSFVVVAITHDEARIWNSSLERDSRPERIHAPEHHERHLHTRKGLNNVENGPSKDDVEIFESVAHAVAGAQEILVIGHGPGLTTSMRSVSDEFSWNIHGSAVSVISVSAKKVKKNNGNPPPTHFHEICLLT